MELHQAKLTHANLCYRLKELRERIKAGTDMPDTQTQIEEANRLMGRYAQAWNPKISAKALAWIQGV